MKMYVLRKSQFVDKPLEQVFPFFEKPENLARITPPAMRFTILTPSPIVMKEGCLIDYAVRILGIRTHWRSIITTYDSPNRFVDEQLLGPYVFWHHTHEFHSVNGGTEMRDIVRYILPFGILGRIAHALFIRSHLEGIFRYRARVIPELLTTESYEIS